MSKSKLIKSGVEVVGNVARNNLERLGSLLDKIEANTEQATNYEAVDLSNIDESSSNDMFRQKTVEASKQLIGPRFARYGKYAKKVVPNSVVNKTMDATFHQVAKLAATWSELDLPNENRLAGVSALSEQERNALATDIANQNRALATMGSVTGLAGLPGLLADTLWLLLVSLRTVYQIAAVYDQPLTGKQGVKMAYKLLESADLSKMQEKQALLAGIGISKSLLTNSRAGGLLGNLDAAGVGDETIKFYAEQVESITEQFHLDLDSIDLSWLIRLIPLSSVAVGAYYNTYLINQVIGVSKATFAPEPKMANKALQDESGTTTNKAADDNEQAQESEKSNVKIESLKDSAKDAVEDKVNLATSKVDDAKEKVTNKVKNKATDLKDQAAEKVEQAKEATQTAKQDIADKASEIQDKAKENLENVEDKAATSKNEIEDKAEQAKAVKDTAITSVAEMAVNLKETIKEDVEIIAEDMKNVASTVKEDAKSVTEDLAELADTAKEDIKFVAEDITEVAKEDSKSVMTDIESSIEDEDEKADDIEDDSEETESKDNKDDTDNEVKKK